MSIINLHFATVTDPDFCRFQFYVEAGREFDVVDYADAYNLNVNDIDAEDIHCAQDAAARLNEGEWLYVSHESHDAGEYM